MSDDLKALLEAADSGAINAVQEMGAPALEIVKPYLEHDDHYVRFLAIECLVALGGDEVPGLLLDRLEKDDEMENQLEALNALSEHLPIGQEQRLQRIFDAMPSGRFRKPLAQVLGLLGTPQAFNCLSLSLNTGELARDGLVASLSKLGDLRAWSLLAGMLQHARGERIAEVMELFDFAAQPDLLPCLLPVFDRLEIAQDLSSHRETIVRRGVDLAVDRVLTLGDGVFVFDVRKAEQYTDREILAAREYLEALRYPIPEPANDSGFQEDDEE